MTFTGCKQEVELKAENCSVNKCYQENQKATTEEDEEGTYDELASYTFIPGSNTLKIEHKNMYASCSCLGFNITVKQLKNQLIIFEKEKPNEKEPHCKCLVNLAYEIKGIEPNTEYIQIQSEWKRNFTFKTELNKKTYDTVVY